VPLSDIRFQDQALRLLSAALASDRLPHACLFCGPDGVGKEMTARALTATLLCEAGPARELTGGCEECRQCRMLMAGTHPDWHLVERGLSQYSEDAAVRARQSTDLSVEVIREYLINKASSQPYCGRAKVFVVREADRMTTAAQNALLKTLEEPPPNTFVVLLAAHEERLTPTTRSRCQLIPFAPLPTDFVASWLAANHPDLSAEARSFLAAFSGGQPGLARLSADLELHDKKAGVVRLLAGRANGSPSELAAAVLEAGKSMAALLGERRDDLSETELLRESLNLLFSAVSSAFADALRLSCGYAGRPINADQPAEVAALAGRLTSEAACGAIRRLADAQRHLEANANAQLAVESLCQWLSGVMSGPGVKDALRG